MRILLWTSSFHPELGGLQTVCRQLAEGLVTRGHTVMVLTQRNKRALLPREQMSEGYTVVRIPHWPKALPELRGMKRLIYRAFGLRMNRKSRQSIEKTITAFKPDCTNIHFPDKQLEFYTTICHLLGRIVVSLHGHEILRFFETREHVVTDKLIDNGYWESKKELEDLLLVSDAISSCSEWLKKKLLQLFPKIPSDKVSAIYNAVDITRFHDAVAGRNGNFIYAFGRLEPNKGFLMLINAFHLISNQYPDLCLKIAGSGFERGIITDRIKQLGLEEKVFLLGRQTPEEVALTANLARINCVPSLAEPFGIVVLEALASNRPVVATNIGGIPEAAGGLAVLCEPNAADMADALNISLKDKRPIDIETRNRHINRFGLEQLVDNYEVLLINPS
jgi:glycosyltransferase involved in cell wall biosynthesis